MGEIVQGKIERWDEGGGVTIRAALPSIDRAILRRYDKVLVEFADGRRISPEQRKKAHSLIAEIGEWAGYLPAEMKRLMKLEFKVKHLQTLESEMFSLSDCSVTTCKEFISFLIDFMIENGVPSKIPLYEQCEDIGRYVYACLMHKQCAVCGRRADVHHLSGSRAGHGGLKWREKDQTGAKVLPLCRVHHELCHNGEAEFLERYHLEGIEMDAAIKKVYRVKKEGKT
jgi:hypothetical protein